MTASAELTTLGNVTVTCPSAVMPIWTSVPPGIFQGFSPGSAGLTLMLPLVVISAGSRPQNAARSSSMTNPVRVLTIHDCVAMLRSLPMKPLEETHGMEGDTVGLVARMVCPRVPFCADGDTTGVFHCMICYWAWCCIEADAAEMVFPVIDYVLRMSRLYRRVYLPSYTFHTGLGTKSIGPGRGRAAVRTILESRAPQGRKTVRLSALTVPVGRQHPSA